MTIRLERRLVPLRTKLAAAAKPKKLVLYHQLPMGDTPEQVVAEATGATKRAAKEKAAAAAAPAVEETPAAADASQPEWSPRP